MAFQHLLKNKALCVNDGELIVGERGPAPKATPTYPELCCHTLDDFEIMNRRNRTTFEVSDQVKKVYAERIIPFWTGKTMREKVFGAMTNSWKQAFEAGVFTEFMEQRAPGHAILDGKIYKRGLLDLQDDVRDSLRKLDYLNDPQAYDKEQELKGMNLAIDAVLTLARRYSEKCSELASQESNTARKAELNKMAAIMFLTSMRGFKEVVGSWKTICSLPRIPRRIRADFRVAAISTGTPFSGLLP